MNKINKFLTAIAVVVLHVGANATVVNASNSGWYRNTGSSNGTEGNTCAGCGSGGYRNWLGFNLTSFSGTVTSATLSIFSDAKNNPNQQINWYDVSTTYSALGTSSAAIYTDLGAGSILASDVQNPGIYNNFALNSIGLANLTSALGGFWAVGGSNVTGGDAFGWNVGVTTNAAFYQLDIQTIASANVPEPESIALVGLALAILVMTSRKAKKA